MPGEILLVKSFLEQKKKDGISDGPELPAPAGKTGLIASPRSTKLLEAHFEKEKWQMERKHQMEWKKKAEKIEILNEVRS